MKVGQGIWLLESSRKVARADKGGTSPSSNSRDGDDAVPRLLLLVAVVVVVEEEELVGIMRKVVVFDAQPYQAKLKPALGTTLTPGLACFESTFFIFD